MVSMARTWLIALLTAVAAALLAPLSAQARTPCPGEQVTPTAVNVVQVNDAISCLTNQVRAHYGLPTMRRDARLDAAATLHSLDMGTRAFFSHVNPDGLNPGARATAQGYTLGVGENIAYGYPNARAVVLGWVASANHCRNVLSGAADLGVGTVVGAKTHYTQVLGDYFTRAVSDAPAGGCPYTLNLDTLNAAAATVVAGPAAVQPTATTQPAATAAAAKLSLRGLSLAPSRLRAGRGGTTISYTLSAPATVTFRIERASGSRVRYRTMSRRLTHRGVAGANAVRFSGRLGGSSLRPGRYRLQAIAEDAAGRTSGGLRARFFIVR